MNTGGRALWIQEAELCGFRRQSSVNTGGRALWLKDGRALWLKDGRALSAVWHIDREPQPA